LLRLAGLFFGLGFILVGIYGVRRNVDRLKWSSAPATVITSQRGGDHRPAYVIAQYRLGKAIYHCGKVFRRGDDDEGDPADYPVGMKTDIYYDPAQPARCALTRGISRMSLVFIALGVVLLGAANYARRKIKKPPAPQ